MKKKKNKARNEEEEEEKKEQKKRLDIIKAVAQAWLNHFNNSKTSYSELEARRRYSFVRDKPSRFKVEALSVTNTGHCHVSSSSSSRWDFGQSLWDSYEIVAVSKKLERGLALENTFSCVMVDADEDLSRLIGLMKKKKKENRNTLKSLFYRACSRRYNNSDVNITES